MFYRLPYPPSVNQHLRTDFRSGRVLVSREWREYRQAVHLLLAMQRPGPPLEGRIAVDIVAYCPDKRRRDLDNLIKALADALEGILYLNDSQIDALSIRREYALGTPGHLEVRITPAQVSVGETAVSYTE